MIGLVPMAGLVGMRAQVIFPPVEPPGGGVIDPGPADPVARFEWEAPDRYSQGWMYYDEETDRYPEAYYDPDNWILHFDASGSFAGSDRITEYRWRFESLDGEWSEQATTTIPWYPERIIRSNSRLMELAREVNNQPIEQRVETYENSVYAHPDQMVRFPEEGTYQVTLTIENDLGRTSTTSQSVRVEDHFIVSLGDSFASGQGNPEIDLEAILETEVNIRVGNLVNNQTREEIRQELREEFNAKLDAVQLPVEGEENPFKGTYFKRLGKLARIVPRLAFLVSSQGIWKNEDCFRSGISGPSLSAAEFELRDPETSITYISFACSGGTTDDVLNQIRNLRSHLEPDFSLPPVQGSFQTSTSKRSIDALTLSVGGNDLGFADLLALCGGFDKVVNADGALEKVASIYDVAENFFLNNDDDCNTSELARGAKHILAEHLPEKYDEINDALRANGLDVEEIYITQYPETFFSSDIDDAVDALMFDQLGRLGSKISELPTPDSAEIAVAKVIATFLGGFDEQVELVIGALENIFSVDLLDDCGVFSEVNKEESIFMTVMAKGLNAAVRAAAYRNHWNYVQGIAEAFKGHHYCASNPYFRGILDSFNLQGDVDGTLHPNFKGVQVVRNALLRDIYLGPDLRPQRIRVVFDEIEVEDNVEEHFDKLREEKSLVGVLVQQLLSGGGLAITLNGYGTGVTWEGIPADPIDLGGFSLEVDLYRGDVPPRLAARKEPLRVTVAGNLTPYEAYVDSHPIPDPNVPGSDPFEDPLPDSPPKPDTDGPVKIHLQVINRPIGVSQSHSRADHFGEQEQPHVLEAENPSGGGRLRVVYHVYTVDTRPGTVLPPDQDPGVPGPDPEESSFIGVPSYVLERRIFNNPEVNIEFDREGIPQVRWTEVDSAQGYMLEYSTDLETWQPVREEPFEALQPGWQRLWEPRNPMEHKARYYRLKIRE